MKLMSDHFFLRDGFDRFHLEPQVNRALLIGERDRAQRDRILDAIEEGCYGMEGHKAVVYGDFGRGKTHEAQNIMFEIERRGIPVVPVYVQCHEFRAKEPFASLFGLMISGLGAERVNRAVNDYEHLMNEGKAEQLVDVMQSAELAQAFRGLSLPNLETVRLVMRWLGGEEDIDMSGIGPNLRPALTLSRDFAAVMKGLSHVFRAVEKKVLVFFIDEAERLALITNTDTYWSWVGSLRTLTENLNVGYVFYVGAKTRDLIPEMLLGDEVVTRIGANNYCELLNPGQDELRQWIKELFQTLVRKGAIPSVHAEVLPKAATDASVPTALQSLVGSDAKALACYPFTPDALDEFVTECATQNLANRPREVLKRIQAAAKRAMRKERSLIDPDILKEVQGDGF